MKLRLHRRSQETPPDTRVRTSSVHVLRDEDDLRRAVQRAAEFDQRAGDALLSRSARYRSLLTDGNDAEPGEWRPDGIPPGNGHPQ
jgi:hypothetical protein